MIFTTKPDIYSVVRALACYGAVATMMAIFGMSATLAALFTLIGALGLELLDELNHKKGWDNRFLDPRGGNWLDVIIVFGATFVGYLVF